MSLQPVTAEVISCPGRLGDMVYQALQINVAGLNTPFVLTLALPAVGFKALSAQAEPAALYGLIAGAINAAKLEIEVSPGA